MQPDWSSPYRGRGSRAGVHLDQGEVGAALVRVEWDPVEDESEREGWLAGLSKGMR